MLAGGVSPFRADAISIRKRNVAHMARRTQGPLTEKQARAAELRRARQAKASNKARRRTRDVERAQEVFEETGESLSRLRSVARQNKARAAGYITEGQRRRLTRLYPNVVERKKALDRELLAHFGVTAGQLLAIRMRNIRHSYGADTSESLATREIEQEFGGRAMLNVDFARVYIDIQTYQLGRDRHLDSYLTFDDVGYAISYHAAVVNEKSNYDALEPSKRTASGKEGNAAQWWYLVEFSHIYSADTYEERYGARSKSQAEREGHPRQ